MTEAEIFMATVSALSGAIQVMIAQDHRLDAYRNRFPELRSRVPRKDLPADYLELMAELNTTARQEGQRALEDAERTPIASVDLKNMRSIPEPIMVAMRKNVDTCWKRLEHFLAESLYTPEERTRVHVFARQCVCRELKEILNYLDELPPDLQGYWNACSCPNPIEILNQG